MKSMKILYICTFYHKVMVFRDSANELINMGHEVEIFNAVKHNEPVDAKYKSIMDESVIQAECFNKYDRFIFWKKQNKIMKEIEKQYDLNEFDLIHAHTTFNGGYVAYKINKKYKIPYFVSFRDTDLNAFLKIPFMKITLNKILKKASGIQFLSHPYKEILLNKYVYDKNKKEAEDKSEIIYNGLEKFWVDNKYKPKKYLKNNPLKLICVGSIDKRKNMSKILSVMDELELRGIKANLTIVGQVDNKDNKQILNKLKSDKRVNIMPFMKKEELIHLYRTSDIYIMPSKRETFGRVYAEAMTQGLPIIYTKGQGFDGIFNEGIVGFSTEYNDIDCMANSIENIISNYEEISANCIKHSEIFSWNKIGEKIERFYYEKK